MRWSFLLVLAIAGHCYARTLPEIVNDLEAANNRQKQELADTQSKLAWTWSELNVAQEQVNAVAKERDGWRAYGESEHDKWMNAEKRVAEGKAGLLRRDLIIGVMTLLIGAYAVLKFYFHIPI